MSNNITPMPERQLSVREQAELEVKKEQAEIRKRNAQRERALEATKFHAQILTLAA